MVEKKCKYFAQALENALHTFSAILSSVKVADKIENLLGKYLLGMILINDRELTFTFFTFLKHYQIWLK